MYIWNSGGVKGQRQKALKFLLCGLRKEIKLQNWSQIYNWRVEGAMKKSFLQHRDCCRKTRYSSLSNSRVSLKMRFDMESGALPRWWAYKSCCVHTFLFIRSLTAKSNAAAREAGAGQDINAAARAFKMTTEIKKQFSKEFKSQSVFFHTYIKLNLRWWILINIIFRQVIENLSKKKDLICYFSIHTFNLKAAAIDPASWITALPIEIKRGAALIRI